MLERFTSNKHLGSPFNRLRQRRNRHLGITGFRAKNMFDYVFMCFCWFGSIFNIFVKSRASFSLRNLQNQRLTWFLIKKNTNKSAPTTSEPTSAPLQKDLKILEIMKMLFPTIIHTFVLNQEPNQKYRNLIFSLFV